MKNILLRTAIRDIKQTPARFLSLISIIFLGVAFFVGIRATAPDMKQAANHFFQQEHLMDLQVFSPLGFQPDQIERLQQQTDVSTLTTQKQTDVETLTSGQVVRLFDFEPKQPLNQLTLLKGNFPQKSGEIVVDELALKDAQLKIGSKIRLHATTALKVTEFTVVGYAKSPLFLDKTNRGLTAIGSGAVNFFAYIPPKDFALTAPNLVNIGLTSESRQLATYSTDYQQRVNQVKRTLNREFVPEMTKQLHQQFAQQGSTQQVVSPQLVRVTTRQDLPGYTEYKENANRIGSLATVFPAIFFFIAGLISLTSVRRMVDEKRIEIGSLYAMGYRPNEIAQKFLLYVGLAGLLGLLGGLLVGFLFFPSMIINAYTSVYSIQGFETTWYLSLSLLALLVTFSCTVGIASIVLVRELQQYPAELMRPKAPKAGQRILLERLTTFWSSLSFNYKVMFRNLFRYKGRMWLTIIGIAGCTAMILTGFGLKDSISAVVPLQFEKIWHYQAVVTLNQEESSDSLQLGHEKQVKEQQLVANNEVTVSKQGNKKQKATLTVPKVPTTFLGVQTLVDATTKQPVKLTNTGAIVTKKLAELYAVKTGDSLTVNLAAGQVIKVKVSGIIENYVGHQLLMTPTYYQELTQQQPVYKTMLIQVTTTTAKQLADMAREWRAKNPTILNVHLLTTTQKEMEQSMGVLTLVVWILIVSAGVLAFVVLYSLNSMNISERLRELSTMKVLGFYEKEVTLYVFRENIILSFGGIVFGIVGGRWLHQFVIRTVEMDNTLFVKQIHWESYGYSAIITLIFTCIVGFVMHRQLKKIAMLDALKANE